MFVPYTSGQNQHPGNIVETASLSRTPLPRLRGQLSLPEKCQSNISTMQLETVAYVNQSFKSFNNDGSRGGFFLGDGTGVGKGRCIAAIFVDQFTLHVKEGKLPHLFRGLWVSVNKELQDAAISDMSDVLKGASIDVTYNEELCEKGGWTFFTYSTLSRSSAKKTNLVKWLEEGATTLIVFDEAHRAKNLICNGQHASTLTAKAVLALQQQLPDARVVYSSATGVSEVRHLAYMVRLNQWGPHHTQFKSFQDFYTTLRGAGIDAMEMFSCQLKQTGKYLARTMSFDDVGFEIRHVNPTAAQIDMYRQCTTIWSVLMEHGGSSWTAHQRFFRQLLVGFKVSHTIETIEELLVQNYAVVVGLQSTGEAHISNHSRDLPELPSTLRAELLSHVAKVLDPVIAAALRSLVDGLQLPPNTLDSIINHFHVSNVSEITGRRQRWERGADGLYHLVTRKRSFGKRKRNSSGQSATLNLIEKARFQQNETSLCIISEAGATGISLHANKSLHVVPKKRAHIFLELPWSCDTFLQQSGRTHRSNQHFAPRYVLMASTVPAEQRFIASITSKLQSLGALTLGNRDASHVASMKLRRYNIMTPAGNSCLRNMMGFFIEQAAFRHHQLFSVNNLPQLLHQLPKVTKGYGRWLLRIHHNSTQDDVRTKFLTTVAQCLDNKQSIGVSYRCKMWLEIKDLYTKLMQRTYCDVSGFYADGHRSDESATFVFCKRHQYCIIKLYVDDIRVPEMIFHSKQALLTWLEASELVRIRDTREAWLQWSPESLLYQAVQAYRILSNTDVTPLESSNWSKDKHRHFEEGFRVAVKQLVRVPIISAVLDTIFEYASAWSNVSNFSTVVDYFDEVGISCQKMLKLTVKNFLNRLLAMNIPTQKMVMGYFQSRMLKENRKQERRQKVWGVYEKIEVVSTNIITTKTEDRLGIELVTLSISQQFPRLSWEQLQTRVCSNVDTYHFVRHYVSRKVACVIVQHGSPEVAELWRCVSASKPIKRMPLSSVSSLFEAVTEAEAREQWTANYDKMKKSDETKCKIRHLLIGPVLTCWVAVQSVIGVDMSVVRAILHSGKELVGIDVPNNKVGEVLRSICC
jgi:hypothetical protein